MDKEELLHMNEQAALQAGFIHTPKRGWHKPDKVPVQKITQGRNKHTVGGYSYSEPQRPQENE